MDNKILKLLRVSSDDGVKKSIVRLSGNTKKEGDYYYHFKQCPDIRFDIWDSLNTISIYGCEDSKLKKVLNDSLERYFWIFTLFTRAGRLFEQDLFSFWIDTKHIKQTFKKEQSELDKDEWLLLYWILHFGLLGDRRTFERLKAKVSLFDNEYLNDAVKLIEAILSNSQEIQQVLEEIKKTTKTDFYIKLSNIAFNYSYEPSLLAYQHSHQGTNKLVYWTVKHANLENSWENLNEDLKDISSTKQSFAYIQANNPFIDKEKQKEYATHYLKEMEENVEDYSKALNSLVSLFNIYQKIEDLPYLAKIIQLYYQKVSVHSTIPKRLNDTYNEVMTYLNTNGVEVKPIKPIHNTILECFDEVGYKQIELSLYEKDAVITGFLNTQEIYTNSLHKMLWDKKTPSNDLYLACIETYKQKGFIEVESLGDLEKTTPKEKQPEVIAKIMTFSEFCLDYPEIYFEQVWWKGWNVLVYEKKFTSKFDIDLNEVEDIFNKNALIFLDDLEVKGDILNPVMEYGRPIFVKGKTKAKSVSAGGGYLNFEGGLEVENTLVTHYNDGHISIGESLTAKVFFRDGDHSTYLPNKDKWDIGHYYHSDPYDYDENTIEIKYFLKKQDLMAFKNEEWVDIEEDIDYSECDDDCDDYDDDEEKKKECIEECMKELLDEAFWISFSTIADQDLEKFALKIGGLYQ